MLGSTQLKKVRAETVSLLQLCVKCLARCHYQSLSCACIWQNPYSTYSTNTSTWRTQIFVYRTHCDFHMKQHFLFCMKLTVLLSLTVTKTDKNGKAMKLVVHLLAIKMMRRKWNKSVISETNWIRFSEIDHITKAPSNPITTKITCQLLRLYV